MAESSSSRNTTAAPKFSHSASTSAGGWRAGGRGQGQLPGWQESVHSKLFAPACCGCLVMRHTTRGGLPAPCDPGLGVGCRVHADSCHLLACPCSPASAQHHQSDAAGRVQKGHGAPGGGPTRQLLLVLSIPLGQDVLQAHVHQRHGALLRNHPAGWGAGWSRASAARCDCAQQATGNQRLQPRALHRAALQGRGTAWGLGLGPACLHHGKPPRHAEHCTPQRSWEARPTPTARRWSCRCRGGPRTARRAGGSRRAWPPAPASPPQSRHTPVGGPVGVSLETAVGKLEPESAAARGAAGWQPAAGWQVGNAGAATGCWRQATRCFNRLGRHRVAQARAGGACLWVGQRQYYSLLHLLLHLIIACTGPARMCGAHFAALSRL